MSNLTLAMLLGAMAEVDLIARPWAPFIGLVELRESAYCDENAVFAISAQPGFDMGDSVLCRSFAPTLALVQGVEPRIATRDECSAYLYWAITNQPRKLR